MFVNVGQGTAAWKTRGRLENRRPLNGTASRAGENLAYQTAFRVTPGPARCPGFSFVLLISGQTERSRP